MARFFPENFPFVTRYRKFALYFLMSPEAKWHQGSVDM